MSAQPTFTVHDFYTELVNHRSPHGSELDIIEHKSYRTHKLRTQGVHHDHFIQY